MHFLYIYKRDLATISHNPHCLSWSDSMLYFIFKLRVCRAWTGLCSRTLGIELG